MRIRPYQVWSADLEFPYACILSVEAPSDETLVAPIFLDPFLSSFQVPLPEFKKRAIIAINQMKIIPPKRLMKRIGDLEKQRIQSILYTIREMVAGYQGEKVS